MSIDTLTKVYVEANARIRLCQVLGVSVPDELTAERDVSLTELMGLTGDTPAEIMQRLHYPTGDRLRELRREFVETAPANVLEVIVKGFGR